MPRQSRFRLPAEVPDGTGWQTMLDTANRDYTGGAMEHPAGGHLLLRQRSVCLLTAITKDQ